jgi:hypothetical protein
MADAGEHDEDPWAKVHMDPRPYCDTCEGSHDDHAAWLAERAAMVAAWSQAVRDLGVAIDGPRAVLNSIAARSLGGVDGGEEASSLCASIGRLAGELQRIADAAAWRAQQEAAAAAQGAPGGE